MNADASRNVRRFDAFLSHSSKDLGFAAKLVQSLEAEKLKAWIDHSHVRFGALLRNELQAAIADSRALVLVWSESAAPSRWVMAELFTAFHLGRFIIPCVLDKTALPHFLQKTAYLDRKRDKAEIGTKLSRAIRNAPDGANRVPVPMHSPSALVKSLTGGIAAGQFAVLSALEKDFAAAAKANAHLRTALTAAEKIAPLDPLVLNLAGYQCKNDYLIKHYAAIRAGLPPPDPLLTRGERYFFDTLCVDPSDVSAVNGLASILVYERELDAAEFFTRRAIDLAKGAGGNYEAALHDLDLILHYKKGR